MGAMITPEPYLTKDGRSRFKVRFRLDGVARSRTTGDDAAAQEFVRLIHTLGVAEAVRILDERQGAPDGTATVESWCAEHIDSLSGVQPDTLGRYRAYVRNDLGSLAHRPLTAVTPDVMARWVNELAKSGASGKTIKNKHGFLSAAFAHAVHRGLIPSNPCKGTRLPRTVTEPMVFLTHDEYARFIGYVVPYWQPLVVFLFSTGLRWSEATALVVGKVDLEQGTATVSQAWKRGNVLGPPKSKKSRRTVSLAPETVELLRPLVEGRPADEYVFLNQRGGPVRLATFHDNVWQPAVRLANGKPAQDGKRIARRRDGSGKIIEPAKVPLGKSPRPHDARHTCASWLLGAGVPINYVQAHLGHESITTTVDRYGHVMPAARQAIAGAMSLALSQAHPQIEG